MRNSRLLLSLQVEPPEFAIGDGDLGLGQIKCEVGDLFPFGSGAE